MSTWREVFPTKRAYIRFPLTETCTGISAWEVTDFQPEQVETQPRVVSLEDFIMPIEHKIDAQKARKRKKEK